ncbi:aldehyde reductase [Solirubrobacter phytolaccae]|uniref:Aldehyde reductase n=1 Tax=Solirubrobacter phytolaccae TaxID=1404360 RepID=A0A9X3NB34_9ACTN|nr:aldehyde reductase [Solirubrobacter phytolaccae]MDA0182834.1 aldehyde reductase [Solirubrobacter phytolaccae]
MSTVLLTGGSGFLGLHTTIQLLERGYDVRATVRSAKRAERVRATLGDPARLQLVIADLLSDDGWAEAAAGADYVLHTASPFPAGAPDHEDDLIVPARDGTLRVLRAALDAGVRRVVVTSSFAAVGYGREPGDHVFTEADWTDPTADIGAYIKSKAIAERAAWDFARETGLELAVVNPVGIFGPVLGSDRSASIGMVSGLLDGTFASGMPRLAFSVVDVRDAADLHLRAMTDPAAAGERFIAASGDGVWLADLARILRERLGADVPTAEIPDDVLREAAKTNPALDSIAREVGNFRHLSAEKARRVLGWAPRPLEETVVDTAESLNRST